LVNGHTTTQGESWKARAPQLAARMQALAFGMTTTGADRVVADKAQTYCPRLKGLAPGFLINRSCPATYELLNNGVSAPSNRAAETQNQYAHNLR